MGEEHPSVASYLHNLAGLYKSQGRYEEAEPLYIQSLDMYKKLFREEHPFVAMSLWHLAVHYQNQKVYTSAETFYIQALDIFRQSLGDKHPYTQGTQRAYQALLDNKKLR